MRRPLSEIIKQMASTIFRDQDAVPSGEAAHASLLLAHIAWNRATGFNEPSPDYQPLLRQFEASNRALWSELTSSDADGLIAQLMVYKQAHFPNDQRQIVVCGMRGDNVRVEWFDPPATRAASPGGADGRRGESQWPASRRDT